MDINEIKKLIRSENDRIIILDSNGNPEFIISAFPKSNELEIGIQNQDCCSNEHNSQKDQAGRLTIEDLPYL
jgi:hypothetical protein